MIIFTQNDRPRALSFWSNTFVDHPLGHATRWFLNWLEVEIYDIHVVSRTFSNFNWHYITFGFRFVIYCHFFSSMWTPIPWKLKRMVSYEHDIACLYTQAMYCHCTGVCRVGAVAIERRIVRYRSACFDHCTRGEDKTESVHSSCRFRPSAIKWLQVANQMFTSCHVIGYIIYACIFHCNSNEQTFSLTPCILPSVSIQIK